MLETRRSGEAGHYTNFNLPCIYSLNCSRHAHSVLEQRIVALNPGWNRRLKVSFLEAEMQASVSRTLSYGSYLERPG